MDPKRTLLARVLEEGAELDGVLGKRGGRDRRLGWGELWKEIRAVGRCLERLPEPCPPDRPRSVVFVSCQSHPLD